MDGRRLLRDLTAHKSMTRQFFFKYGDLFTSIILRKINISSASLTRPLFSSIG